MTSALVLMQMLAKEKEPDRSVEFCMVFSNTLDSSDALLANIRNLKDQTHKDWKAAYFKNKFNFTAHVPNVRVFNSFNNEGRNIYEAITTYCSQKSYVFILHTTEDFFAKTTLANISR